MALSLYLLMPAVLSWAASPAHRKGPHLPRTVYGLTAIIAMEAALFCAWFGLAWVFGRPNRQELAMGKAVGLRGILAGLAEAAVIWVGLAAALSLLTGLAAVVFHVSPETLAALRPRVENVVDVEAMRRNPFYFALLLTVVSFGLGGLREELWRAAMLAGVRAMWPSWQASSRARTIVLLAVAVLFGIGHWPQGPGGILATSLLGVAFGSILIVRQSLWEAALAHGFFDAANFALLFLQ